MLVGVPKEIKVHETVTSPSGGLPLLAPIIGLGMAALRHGPTKGARIAAWVAAQAVFLYIVAVALTRKALIVW